MDKTSNLGLNLPDKGYRDWDVPINENFEILDSRTLQYRNLTNCILEVPQDIKLAHSSVNKQLTLKSGSALYIPDGFNGTKPKFIRVVVSGDQTGGTGSGRYFYCYNPSQNLFGASQVATSAEEPESPVNLQYWYDTANNKMKRYINNAWVEGFSLPFCVASTEAVLDIFNGFGYIGRTNYALPGVRGLIAVGRNADGSLKTREFVVRDVITKTEKWGVEPYVLNISADSSAEYMGFVRAQDYYEQDTQPNEPDGSWGKWFSPRDNMVYQDKDSTAWTSVTSVFVGTMSINSDRSIAGIDIKLPFKAVDQNDFNKLDEEVVKTGGDQTISGVKTFTDVIERPFTFGSYGTAAVEAIDSNNKGYIEYKAYYAGNGVYNRMQTTNTTSGKHAYIDIVSKDDGTGTFQINGTSTISANLTKLSAIQVPTPAASDNSTQIATTNWCYDPAKSTNLVHRTGNETVNGVKTFTSNIIHRNSNIELSTAPSSNQYSDIAFHDKNGVPIALVEYRRLAQDSGSGINLVLRKKGSESSAAWGRLGIFQDASGNYYTQAPTPATSDSSTKIATTAFVKNNLGSKLGLPNYSAAVAIADSTASYTPPSHGIIQMGYLSAGDNTYNGGVVHGPSGVNMASQYSAYKYSNGGTFWCIVEKGVTYTLTTSQPNKKFIPFK